MKKKILIALSVSILMSTNAFADFSGKYAKKNATVAVSQEGNEFTFSLNSSMGMHACDMEGRAIITKAGHALYKTADDLSHCEAIFELAGNKLTVRTRECDGYCGMNASGTMDGAYRKKISGKR
jgi:hypothetical protein